MYPKKIYTLRISIAEDAIRYFIAFHDEIGNKTEIEVGRKLYEEFVKIQREDNHQHYLDRKHREYLPLTEEQIEKRAAVSSDTIEDEIARILLRKNLEDALDDLPDIQYQRFLMRYGEKLAYKDIAQIESCSIGSVYDSIKAAKKRLKKFLEKVSD
jgi:RNA polymerase sigma factor (sigma-70 family)